MGIELYWDNDEQTILLCEFDGHWTWDEMFRTLNAIKKITDKAEYEIGAIVDVRNGLNFPGGSMLSAENFERAKQILKFGEGGTGPIAVVGANSVVKAIYSTMLTINKHTMSNIHFADTAKQARAYLNQRMLV